MLKLTLLAQDGSVSTALAVASYPTGDELITFGGGQVSCEAAQRPLTIITTNEERDLPAAFLLVMLDNPFVPFPPGNLTVCDFLCLVLVDALDDLVLDNISSSILDI